MTSIVSIEPSANVADALAKIRAQLQVNLAYARDGTLDEWALAMLQSHIEDQLKEIERHSGLAVTPYPARV